MSAEVLQRWMKDQNIKAGDLAAMLGVNLSTAWRWLSGDVPVPRYVFAFLFMWANQSAGSRAVRRAALERHHAEGWT